MKTSILAIILSLATTIPVFAKNWYCTDYDQYVSRNFTPLTPDSLKLTFERRGETEKYWKGGADFRLKSGNDSIDQFLAEKVRYLIYEDSLYVNCKDLRCDGVFLGERGCAARAFRLLAGNIAKGTKKIYNVTGRYNGFFGSIRRNLKKNL